MESERHLTFDNTELVNETIAKRPQICSIFHTKVDREVIQEDFVRDVYATNRSDYTSVQRYEHYQTMCHFISLLPAQTFVSNERMVLQICALCFVDFSNELVKLIRKYYGEDTVDTISTLMACTRCNENYDNYQRIDTRVLLMRLLAHSHIIRPFHVHIYWVYKAYDTDNPYEAPTLTCVAKQMLTLANSEVKPLMHVLYTRFPSSHRSTTIFDNFSRNEIIWMTYYTAERVSMDLKLSESSKLSV